MKCQRCPLLLSAICLLLRKHFNPYVKQSDKQYREGLSFVTFAKISIASLKVWINEFRNIAVLTL